MIEASREVSRFALAMEAQLHKNAHKDHNDGGRGWRFDSVWSLINRLDEEVAELKAAVSAEQPAEVILSEAADVANFAMMIASRCRAL